MCRSLNNKVDKPTEIPITPVLDSAGSFSTSFRRYTCSFSMTCWGVA